MSSIYISKKHYGLIKVCKKILNLKDDHQVSVEDVEKIKQIIESLLVSNSPREINDMFNLNHSNFTMFISKSLKIKSRSRKEARCLHSITTEQQKYRQECQFKFDVYRYPNIPGFQLLSNNDWYSKNNRTGLQRDHMLSISYGWKNKIDPSIISHPANCEILLADDNIKKGPTCSISLEELNQRILSWDNNSSILNTYHRPFIPKPEKHKLNVSRTLSGRVYYNNGVRNFWIYPAKGETPDPTWVKGFYK